MPSTNSKTQGANERRRSASSDLGSRSSDGDAWAGRGGTLATHSWSVRSDMIAWPGWEGGEEGMVTAYTSALCVASTLPYPLCWR